MSFFKKLFGKDKKEEIPQPSEGSLPWIAPADNAWGLRLLDLRPISQTRLSASADPVMAKNAVSYKREDGTVFWGQEPQNKRSITAAISIPTDGSLAPGVLFVPGAMEHKWAIYFDGEHLIFVRSWLRQVLVRAKTAQKNNELLIESITGQFTDGEGPEFTKAILNFLLISHAIGEVVPAPLPKKLETDTEKAGLWAFSVYGNMAHIGVFDEGFISKARGRLRSHSLLHIAVAKGNIAEMEKQLKQGVNINALAGDGLATLHWSMANAGTEPMRKLLELGADPNVVSTQGATPIMNAAQSNKPEHLKLLLDHGASVNARDNKGFTALHRAAEMGHLDIVKILLDRGADRSIAAEGHTALSFAQARGHKEIIDLLTSGNA